MKQHDYEKIYYETRAKLTLQRLFPEELSSLISSDKPDLKTTDNKVGIEVTRAVSYHDAEKTSFFSKELCGKLESQVDHKKLEKFCNDGTRLLLKDDIGAEPDDEIIGFSPEAVWHNTQLVENTIKQKIIHINQVPYQDTERLNLYVFSDTFKDYKMSDMEELVDHIMKCQPICEKRFKILYFDDCGWFYRCDLESGEIIFYSTEEIIHAICVDAKAFAEEKA